MIITLWPLSHGYEKRSILQVEREPTDPVRPQTSTYRLLVVRSVDDDEVEI